MSVFVLLRSDCFTLYSGISKHSLLYHCINSESRLYINITAISNLDSIIAKEVNKERSGAPLWISLSVSKSVCKSVTHTFFKPFNLQHKHLEIYIKYIIFKIKIKSFLSKKFVIARINFDFWKFVFSKRENNFLEGVSRIICYSVFHKKNLEITTLLYVYVRTWT